MHHYGPLSDRQDLEHLQREQAKLTEKHGHMQEKLREADALLRTIQGSDERDVHLQRCRQEITDLKDRITEFTSELEARILFTQKSIRVRTHSSNAALYASLSPLVDRRHIEIAR